LLTLYGLNASFRSKEQEKALDLIIAGESQVIAVLPTGEGKSLLFMLPAMLQGASLTIVIVPLIALKEDLIKRCMKLRIRCSMWQEGMESSGSPPLIFVGSESATSAQFHAFIRTLESEQRLDQIVLNECHLLLTESDYRPSLLALKGLSRFTCQIVCLTATLPPLRESELARKLLLTAPTIIRKPTLRVNLQYTVVRLPQKEFEIQVMERVVEAIQSLGFRDRILCYVRTVQEAEHYAKVINCEAYYANAPDKANIISRWLSDSRYTRSIVATTALDMGVDYNKIRFVIYLGAPGSMTEFAQGSVRTGRYENRLM